VAEREARELLAEFFRALNEEVVQAEVQRKQLASLLGLSPSSVTEMFSSGRGGNKMPPSWERVERILRLCWDKRDRGKFPGMTDVAISRALEDALSRHIEGWKLRHAMLIRDVERARAVAYHTARPRQGLAGMAVWLSPRPALLAGRETLLGDLHAHLMAGGGSQVRTAALCGLAGVGKTSVAVEYAHRHLDEKNVVWQLAAEDPAVLVAGMAELAAQLGVRDRLDIRDPVASVHSALAASSAHWLMMFDNAPDSASVRPFLPPAGSGCVLITSQSSRWPAGQAVDVPPLDTASAAGFLMRRAGDPDHREALELAVELGGLPLALEQAAAYALDTRITLASYRAMFQEHRDDLLARGEPTDYDKTVATTWSLAFARLEQNEPTAIALLQLLACYAPEPVPLGLLVKRQNVPARQRIASSGPELAQFLNDPLQVSDAVAALRRYSLITHAGTGTVIVHRLVQVVTLAQMADELTASWRLAAAALIEAAIPADTSPPAAWPDCTVLLPHAKVALDAASAGMERIAEYLAASGSYAAARDLWRRIAEAREQDLGPEHPETLAARHEFAMWTGEAGDLVAARESFAGLVPACGRALGPEHTDTLNAQCNLAFFTGQTGDAASARDMYAAVVPIRERVFGPGHPDSLTDRGNLATWTGMAGDAAAARDLFAGLLPAREQAQGLEHPLTLGTRHELGSWTGRAGDPAAARDLFADLVHVRERIQGADHPHALFARFNLAHWTGEAGDPAAARDMFTELVPVLEQIQGDEHPQTEKARQELTRWTNEADG
jgi:Tetratricopeptide repeat